MEMNDETYPGEEQLLYDTCQEMREGMIYFDPENDRILQLTNSKVYFRPQVFWSLITVVGCRKRKVKSNIECKEIMNRCGYEFLGKL